MSPGDVIDGMWLTSPGRDPLVGKLAMLLEVCSRSHQKGCPKCAIREKCERWWNGVSNCSTNHFLTQEDFENYKAKFDRMQATQKALAGKIGVSTPIPH